MRIKGIDDSIEYNRYDGTIYKGIVVKNNDPFFYNRVKIYIPELSLQPEAKKNPWLRGFYKFFMRMPGKNIKQDTFKLNQKQFEEIAETLPWAEPCFPLMGESGVGRYHCYEDKSTKTDGNYPTYTEQDDGHTAPSFLWETTAAFIGDAYARAGGNMTCNENPYAYMGKPSGRSDQTKGVIGIPNVGSQVWVFHDDGDINYPVYFGVKRSFRELALVNEIDQFAEFGPKIDNHHGFDYPGIAENIPEEDA